MPHEPFWLDGVRCQPYGPNGRRVVIVGRAGGCLPKAEVLSVRVRVGESPQEAVLHLEFEGGQRVPKSGIRVLRDHSREVVEECL